MKDLTEGKLQETLEFAKTIQNDSLQECLNHLESVDEIHEGIETRVYNDFAPKSFYFVRWDTFRNKMWMNGGIIFHGAHDNGGEGGSPTFSVSLSGSKETRWEIHT